MDGLQTQWLLDPSAVDLVESTRFAIEAILVAAFGGPGRTRTTRRRAGGTSGAHDRT